MRPTWFAGAALAALLALGAAGSASAQYPSPPPDFAHPGSAHFPLFTPESGGRDRPMLVIYAAWRDVGFPAALDSGQLSGRFFGADPSVAGYFRRESLGRLDLTPAAETDAAGNGAANDGIVRVTIDENKADFFARPEGQRNEMLLRAADPFVNYAAFDTNRDGRLTRLELTFNRVESDTAAIPNGCGVNRGVNPVTLDGTALGDLAAAQMSSAASLMTTAHEVWHNLFTTRDFYGFGVGRFDVSGPTCGGADSSLFGMAAWEKLHLGWINPTVVTRDGFYDVRQADDQRHDAFILYDHAKGTNDFFVVENRQRAGTYDSTSSDRGLVIWRLDETQYGTSDDAVRPVEIMRPDGTTAPGCANNICYSGRSIDAWDPGDVATPQRRMTRTWRDGTAANVAVRAIGRSRATMRPYFDVRGPGVLVDPYALDNGDMHSRDLLHLAPGEANPVTFDVMNTGEAEDTFEFTLTDLPSGWSATTDAKTLGAGVATPATIQLTPASDARADEIYSVTAVGKSRSDGSVTSRYPLTVKVVPKATIDDSSVTEGDAGADRMHFTVTLSEATDRDVRIDYRTADGTASAPDDYESTSGTLTIPIGERTGTISVPVNGDTAPEPDETFFVRLADASNATLVDAEGRGTILTDPEPSASIHDANVEEDDTDLRFRVSLSEANNTPVDVDYATADGTASSPADYRATSGTVHFDTGETEKTVSVPIEEDVVDELNETFTVRLSNIMHANVDRAVATGTIVDDDRDGAFTCRAAGLRLGTSEQSVANPPNVPCRDDASVVGPLSLGLVEVGALRVTTDQTPDDLTGTRPRLGDNGAAHAETADVTIASGLNLVKIAGLTADAKAECTGEASPRLSGSSRVVLLSINGKPAGVVTGRVNLPLILATLRLNETTTGPGGITQRALVLDNLVGPDVVIAEAKAGWVGTDAHPQGSPCTA